MRRYVFWGLVLLVGVSLSICPASRADEPADLVLLGGKIVTGDQQERVVSAVAVRAGRIVAVGSDEEITKLIGPNKTEVIRLEGRTMLPGFIESHCHAVGVARGSLEQEYVEISSITELQAWIRKAAADVPAERWIEVPRNEITRFKERRFPTPAELDAACTTHPVLYNSVSNKWVLNTRGFEELKLLDPNSKLPDGEVLRDSDGRPLLIRGGTSTIRKLTPPRPTHARDEELAALERVLRKYNEVGITSIFERATDPQSLGLFRELREKNKLTTRVTGTFRFSSKTAEGVEKYAASLGLKPGEGDEWIKAGPLKITVDGGIHWGTTRLSERYGEKRTAFYQLADPEYRGEQFFTVAEMKTVFETAHKLGWQMSCHVTGDEGTLRVLEALGQVAAEHPEIRQRRFTLIHAYFPSPEIVRQCKDLGVCVDTQGYLYLKDADTLTQVYGPEWASRFIGLGDWVRGGVPVAVNADHMIGLDPDHAMNSFNPLLMLSIAVTRKTLDGNVHGPHQALSRLDALRTVTQWPAHLSFDEQKLGTIEVGKLADFAVLDGDYLTCPESRIAGLKVLRTIVGGKTVFQREPGESPANGAAARFLKMWGKEGSGAGELHIPIGIAINPADEIFVTDHYNNRVVKFDTEGRQLNSFEVLPNPGGITLDASGNLYIGHFPSSRLGKEKTPDRISVYSPTGQFLRGWGQSGKGEGDFDHPGGLAFGPAGKLYIADQTNRRVQVFDLSGKFLFQWGKYGVQPGEFGGNTPAPSRVGGPQFVAFDSHGRLYTTEASVGRIQRFSADGQPQSAWGDNEDRPGSFGGEFTAFPAKLKGPIGICIDRQDRIWISSVRGRIQQFTSDGKFLRGFGETQGTGPEQFYAPHGVALDSHGHLYVVDTYNHRIQKFDVTD